MRWILSAERFVEESPSRRFKSLKILVYLWHTEILVSTTGCGYTPAPQARLRHRLQHVWGAHISLINEYRTSKCRCQCGAILSCISKEKNKKVHLKKPQKIHGVLRCKDRDGNRGHGFMHRDKNAAVNIMSIYEALAEKKWDPISSRERQSLFVVSLHEEGMGPPG